MIQIRRAHERGRAAHGWLESHHTFSFASYHDPRFMGFRSLRVINEDRVLGGRGFDTHSHQDMEILSYIVEGALEHEDSMGSGAVMRAGDLQLMRAGTGVTHSEYNHSATDPVHFLQIWVVPRHLGGEPAYDQRTFPRAERRGGWRLMASEDGAEGSLQVDQDVSLYATVLEVGESAMHPIAPGRFGWIQVVQGRLTLDDETIEAGDGVAVSEEASITLSALEPSEVLLFDLS